MDDTTLDAIAHTNFCAGCESSLEGAERRIDSHPAGWCLDGYSGLQWIAFHCAICAYDTSLDKLAIPRP